MYDHLDPLFFRQTPAPRHNEPVDTHMAIQRHEQSPNRHRRDHHPSHEETISTFWEDSTRMSVAMLRAFLQTLLAAQTTAQTTAQTLGQTGTYSRTHSETAEKADNSTAPQHAAKQKDAGQEQTGKPVNPAREAAQAYQSTAKAVHDSNYDLWAANGPVIPDDAPALNEHEMEVVRHMIRDLERLEARYIETLEIKDTKNFLQAILVAIDHAMGRD